MGLIDWIGRLFGANASGASAATPAPAQAPVTAGDWLALTAALGQALVPDDVDGLWDEVQQALTAPAQYLARFDDDLASRGIEEAIGVTPWLALVDGLQRRNQNTELDWKLNMGDLVWALRLLNTVQHNEPLLKALKTLEKRDTTGHDALEEAGALLKQQGFSLVTLDIDSDSYPLSILKSAAVEPIAALAQRAGQRVIAL